MGESFEAFLRSLGFVLRSPVQPDGKIRRCNTDDHPRGLNGAYMLSADGGFGWAKNWAVHDEVVTWFAGSGAGAAPAERRIDRAALRRAAQEMAAARARASSHAETYYSRCEPLMGGHPYLAGKGLDMTGCRGLRVDPGGRELREYARQFPRLATRVPDPTTDFLVVPMWHGRRITSVQLIPPGGDKRFWKGAGTEGAMYVIDRTRAPVNVLCEGLATGLAIYAAVREARVVVAFNAGNLAKVAAARQWRGLTCVAADNDHRTVCQSHKVDGLTVPFHPWEERPTWCRCNPGRVYAEKAAAVIGCGVAVPSPARGTDFLDWRSELLAQRIEAQSSQRYPESEFRSQQVVDASIRHRIMAATVFIASAG